VAQLSIPLPGRAATTARYGHLRDELRRHEKQVIQAALRDAGGKVSDAAQALGLHRVVLYRRMRELGLTPAKPSGTDRA
jgi:DNA-binding NtrC family response regulator